MMTIHSVRILPKTAFLKHILQIQSSGRGQSASAVLRRLYATAAVSPAGSATAAAVKRSVPVEEEDQPPVKKDWTETWGTWHEPKYKLRPFPADFKEHPDRDLVNFPHPVRKEWESQTRLGFMPDRFFKFFYKKTGVTGPYVFGVGLIAFLMQKEILVQIDHVYAIPQYAILLYLFHRLLQRPFAKWVEKEIFEEQIGSKLQKVEGGKIQCQEMNKMEMAQQVDVPVMQKNIFEAKRENVALQVEAAYRERMQMVFKELKRRADYLAETEEVRRRFEQKHMVGWIVDQVKKSITPQLEQQVLKQSIADLRGLAPKL